MIRMVGRAEAVLPTLGPEGFDLVLTSPPAYPSPLQAAGSLGMESSVNHYVRALAGVLLRCRRVLKRDGFLVLVIESTGRDVFRPLSGALKRLQYKLLATYRWNHGDGTGSYVIFLSVGHGRLERTHRAWAASEWLIPRATPQGEGEFYEWPRQLVSIITSLTIPDGGSILDPFAGRARALSLLPSKYDVTVIDSVNYEAENRGDEGNLSADPVVRPFAQEPSRPEGSD